MPFPATIETAVRADDQRSDTRIRLNLEATGTLESGGTALVLIHDLSRTGLLMETDAALVLGQAVWVALPHSGDIATTIVWNSGTLFGCRFETPLSHGTLSAARLRNPIPAAVDPLRRHEDAHAPVLFPARLRRLRNERGLSRAALSEKTGFSRPTIWAWESGKTAPRSRNMAALAKALGVSALELVGAEGAGPDPEKAAPTATANLIRVAVQSSKEQIAALAGVSPDNIKIIIEI